MDRNLNTENIYVVVRAESIHSYATGTAGSNSNSHNNFSWNEKLLVDMPVHARSITLEVKCKTSRGSGSKDIGVARVAVSDFLGGSVPDDCLQFLSYRLRNWEGKRNGVVNFSVRLRTRERVAATPEMVVGSCGFQISRGSVTGGVVTGVPLLWNNYASRNV